MEGFRECDETVPVFTLADLSKMYGLYARILGDLGVDQAARVHATRLSEKLESEILDLTSYKQGRDIVLAFDQHMKDVIMKACERHNDTEALLLEQHK